MLWKRFSKRNTRKYWRAVGIIAAQSIKPGTQLTMRTFHIGGAASSSVEQSNSVSPVSGIVQFENLKTIEDQYKADRLSRNTKIKIFDQKLKNTFKHTFWFKTSCK